MSLMIAVIASHCNHSLYVYLIIAVIASHCNHSLYMYLMIAVIASHCMDTKIKNKIIYVPVPQITILQSVPHLTRMYYEFRQILQ